MQKEKQGYTATLLHIYTATPVHLYTATPYSTPTKSDQRKQPSSLEANFADRNPTSVGGQQSAVSSQLDD
jgi:hypothetical protein